MLTQDEAVGILEQMRNVQKYITEELGNAFDELIECLKADSKGYHVWGSPKEAGLTDYFRYDFDGVAACDIQYDDDYMNKRKRMTRNDAILWLCKFRQLSDAFLLPNEFFDHLADIATSIFMEIYGYHIWGKPVYMIPDLFGTAWIPRQKESILACRYKPSAFEKDSPPEEFELPIYMAKLNMPMIAMLYQLKGVNVEPIEKLQ